MLKLMYITNDPDVASIAQKYGVDRIWIDMEYKGKDIRQIGLDSVKNHHTVEDVKRLRPVINTSELMVRVNPWGDDYSKEEIDSVVNAGADLIMLPMWKSVEEVEKFIRVVNGRAKTMLLLETKEAEQCLDDVLKIPGIDEIHIGLNDLHLSYGLTFMFELLSNGTVERISKKIRNAEKPYGFGGIASLGHGDVPAERIIMEHYRLGSTRAILSRSFCDYKKIGDLNLVDSIFKNNLKELRDFERVAESATTEEYESNRQELIIAVDSVVARIKEK